MTDTVVVAEFRTRAEAELAALALDGAGIPYLIQSGEGMLHGPLSPGAQIRVLAEAADHARDLLADVNEPAGPRSKRLRAVGMFEGPALDDVLRALDGVGIPYVLNHEAAGTAVFVRAEHELPAGRALRRA